jgi:hypothetical protein
LHPSIIKRFEYYKPVVRRACSDYGFETKNFVRTVNEVLSYLYELNYCIYKEHLL